MKATLTPNQPAFQPVVLTLVIESLDELNWFIVLSQQASTIVDAATDFSVAHPNYLSPVPSAARQCNLELRRALVSAGIIHAGTGMVKE